MKICRTIQKKAQKEINQSIVLSDEREVNANVAAETETRAENPPGFSGFSPAWEARAVPASAWREKRAVVSGAETVASGGGLRLRG